MEKKLAIVQALVDILLADNIVDEKRAQELISGFKNNSETTFEEFVLDQGLLDKEDLLHALSQYYGVPAFDCTGYFFETEYLRMFPLDVLHRNVFIPLLVEDTIMVIVAHDPSNQDLLPIIGQYVSYEIEFNVGLTRNITDAISEYYETSLTEGYEDQ